MTDWYAALIKALSCSGVAAPVRAAFADCAFKIVRSLALAGTGSTDHKSPLSEVDVQAGEGAL